MGNPGQLPYVVSKGAVQGLTWCLAKELGEEGITVNAVMPGMVETPGTQQYNQEEGFNRVMQNQAIKQRCSRSISQGSSRSWPAMMPSSSLARR